LKGVADFKATLFEVTTALKVKPDGSYASKMATFTIHSQIEEVGTAELDYSKVTEESKLYTLTLSKCKDSKATLVVSLGLKPQTGEERAHAQQDSKLQQELDKLRTELER
jgi:hypothetical protein